MNHRKIGLFVFVRKMAFTLLVLAAAVSVCMAFRNGLEEFDFQWDPAKLLMMGDNPYAYSLEHKPVTHPGFMTPEIAANQLPSCLLLLAPWTVFPQLTANRIWDACNILFTIVLLFLVYRLFFRDDSVIRGKFLWFALLFLAGAPWYILISNGQHLLFSLAFFMGAYYLAVGNKDGVVGECFSGVLLALSAFKYTTIAPLACIFIANRWWKPVIVAVFLHVVATVWCGLHLGESPFALVVQSLKVGSALTGADGVDVASIVHLYYPDVNVSVWANIGYAIYGVLLVCTVAMRNVDNLLRLSTLAVIANLMFYHRVYDFVTLAFPLVYAMKNSRQFGRIDIAIRVAACLNVGWTFFLARAVYRLGVGHSTISFILQVILLFAFLCKAGMLRDENEGAFLKTGETNEQ